MEHIQYKVVVNHEEQYALWMLHKENAAGWRDAGMAGSKSECLEYIRKVWTDMRPLSLRRALDDKRAGSMRGYSLPRPALQAGFASACCA